MILYVRNKFKWDSKIYQKSENIRKCQEYLFFKLFNNISMRSMTFSFDTETMTFWQAFIVGTIYMLQTYVTDVRKKCTSVTPFTNKMKMFF